ncbi:MAG: DUF4231 domain-containing protein [Chloroflexi bacterium]|jgi:hypothetical protein|nr:DUF4231 domain-containing protein [Chloroflexota bacterium]
MNDATPHNQLLETAWRRFATLDKNAISVQKQYIRLRRIMAVLGVLAVLFAILVDNYSQPNTVVAYILQGFLILMPISVSIFAAFTNKFQQGQKYISYRAAAESILKEIYLYRTANKNEPNRNRILSDRLATIQRDLFRGAGGELVLTEFQGDVPPYYDPKKNVGDPGFDNLAGDAYLTYRLEDQLAWHIKQNLKLQRDRKRIQWAILIFGGVGAFLAAWGGSMALWVAFTAAIASALVGWEELRGLDMRVGNYSQVILELNIIRDWWFTLGDEQRADKNISRLAEKTEKALFDKNLEWAGAMRKALAEAEGDEADLVEHFVEEGREVTARIQAKLYDEVEEIFDENIGEVAERVESVIEDSSDVLGSLFAGLTAINEDELDLPPEEAAADIIDDALEGVFDDPFAAYEDEAVKEDETFFDLPPEAESAPEPAYSPPPEPKTVESAVDAAIAASSLFSDESEEIPVEEATQVTLFDDEAEIVAESESEELDDDPEAEGDMHETWDDDDTDQDGDMHEVWDDEDDAFEYDGDVSESWDD